MDKKHRTRKRLRKNRKSSSSNLSDYLESSSTERVGRIKNRRLTSSLLGRDEEVETFLKTFCGWSYKNRLMPEYKNKCFVGNKCNSPLPENIGIKNSLITLNLIGLVGRIPDSICLLTNLTNLELRNGSMVGVIPNNIGDLKQLKNLSFMQNELTGEIPESLYTLSKLESLSLNFNNLEGAISERLFRMTKLKHINLSNNVNLSGSISSHIGRLRDLRSLYFDSTSISSFIPDTVRHCTRLGTLFVSCSVNSLSTSDTGQLCDLVLNENLPRDCVINIFHDVPTNSLVFEEDDLFNYVENEQHTIEEHDEAMHNYLLQYVGRIKAKLEGADDPLM